MSVSSSIMVVSCLVGVLGLVSVIVVQCAGGLAAKPPALKFWVSGAVWDGPTTCPVFTWVLICWAVTGLDNVSAESEELELDQTLFLSWGSFKPRRIQYQTC